MRAVNSKAREEREHPHPLKLQPQHNNASAGKSSGQAPPLYGVLKSLKQKGEIKMRNKNAIILLTILALIAGGLFISCSKKSGEKQLWTCPMHPYYISDKPGDCPICGMKLVKVEKSQIPDRKSQMNAVSKTADSMPGMDMSKPEAPADRVVVKIDPDKQQLINVRTDMVKKRSLGNSIPATAVVAYDPELFYTQQQYISALLSLKQTLSSGDDSAVKSAKDDLNSSETRLKVMGLSDQQISDLKTKAEPDKSLLISDQGKTAWVYAQVYQDDLKYVKRGAIAEVTLSSNPGTIYDGKVVAIDPALNPETRSVRVRILVKNTGGAFKPEMYVNVLIKSATENYLSVPEEAVMDTGSRQIAFVDKGDGYFEPRYVVLGAKIGGYYVVELGLSENEKVVTNANFLIDSESQLKAAIGQMTHKH
jgi:membrane fusion protein, copper/silver efflux system